MAANNASPEVARQGEQPHQYAPVSTETRGQFRGQERRQTTGYTKRTVHAAETENRLDKRQEDKRIELIREQVNIE